MRQPLTYIRRIVVVVCLTFWASSCGDALPTAPAPIAPAATPPAPASVLSLTGVVTDASGNPIADATVAAHLRDGRVPARTDTQGRYEIVAPVPNFTRFEVVAEKVGYEPNSQVPMAMTQDFRLYRIDRFAAGETRRLTITSDDSLCTDGLDHSDYHWRCRTFRVQAHENGTMLLKLVPDDPGETGKLCVTAAPYNDCGGLVAVSVPSGAEMKVTVLTAFHLPRGPQTFTLNTSVHRQ